MGSVGGRSRSSLYGRGAAWRKALCHPRFLVLLNRPFHFDNVDHRELLNLKKDKRRWNQQNHPLHRFLESRMRSSRMVRIYSQ